MDISHRWWIMFYIKPFLNIFPVPYCAHNGILKLCLFFRNWRLRNILSISRNILHSVHRSSKMETALIIHSIILLTEYVLFCVSAECSTSCVKEYYISEPCTPTHNIQCKGKNLYGYFLTYLLHIVGHFLTYKYQC